MPAESYLSLSFDWVLQAEARGGERHTVPSPLHQYAHGIGRRRIEATRLFRSDHELHRPDSTNARVCFCGAASCRRKLR